MQIEGEVEAIMEARKDWDVGTKVDAVKLGQVSHQKVYCWARGFIKDISHDGTTLTVGFEHEDDGSNRKFERYSADLAPYGSNTDDIEWRDELDKGSLVDCIDTEHYWYKSTIVDVRPPTKDFKQVKVAFRIYEEEGAKRDDEGPFNGWNNKYDEWISAYSPRIQKFMTMARQYVQAGKSCMVYECMNEDIGDVMYDSKNRKVWVVSRQHGWGNFHFYTDMLNEFGAKGGFDKILDLLGRLKDSKHSFVFLQHVLDFLGRITNLFHRQFAVYYIPKIKEVVEMLFAK